jgi:hypothetical protein
MKNTFDIPLIAKMIIIQEVFEDEKFIKTEDYFYNNSGSENDCEYCRNTTAWD